MTKIAVIKTGGKQYKVAKGQIITIEKIDKKKGDKIKFETLLTSSTDGKETNIGKPSLGELVEGKIIKQGRGKKIRVVKYKNKTRYLRNKGHRQAFTKIEISSIK
jgi:large subunit ribosomal protein L21